MIKFTQTQIRNAIAQIGKGDYKPGSSTRVGVPYQPIPFFEFMDIAAQKRENVIIEHALLNEHCCRLPQVRTVLDIGANVGYHSFLLARCFGARVVSVEADPANLLVLRMLASNEACTYGRGTVFGVPDIEQAFLLQDHADVTIMLNVHHWIEKARGREATVELMRRISAHTNHLFFQTAQKGCNTFYAIDYLETSDDIAAYLRECGFAQARLVATTDHKKPRYLFHAHH